MLEFKNPPTHGNARGDNEGIADALRARPGEWALCFSNTNRTRASNIKAGRIKSFPLGEFDAVSRNADGDGVDVYIRFVGGAA